MNVNSVEWTKMIEGYKTIIRKHLNKRDKSTDNTIYERDIFLKPKYVGEMMKELDSQLPKSDIDNINRVETFASGHVDYVRKFALYCAEIHLKQLSK
jgi:hypothetical protein